MAVVAPALIAPAGAQRFDDRYPYGRQQQQQQRGFFFPFFFPGPPPAVERPPPPVDSSRAPPARKPETQPTETIVIAGDSMADWLAYGLEDMLAETAETGVIRKVRTHSGLIRYDQRNENQDWAQGLREMLAAEKPQAVIMMIGLNDRQAIRERAPKTPAGQGVTPENQNQDQPGSNEQAGDQPAVLAPETRRQPTIGNHEFRSERWVELYIKRIDDTIAVLKSKGVPVLWVGLPAIRGPRASSDMSFLNDLFRTRAEKAGIVYVDVWDGFVDEAGRFANSGPDPEGQTRRLRTGDGVHFTKAGARKLAHFVERDLRRVLSSRATPVALPTQEEPSQAPARPGVPAPRPVAGPVVPLTATSSGTNELLGGSGARPAGADPVATRVLTRGEAIAAPTGRADDFSWPRRVPTAEDSVPVTPEVTPASVKPAGPPPAQAVAPARQTPRNQAAPSGTMANPAGGPQSGASQSAAGPNTRPPPRRPPPRADSFDSPPRPPMPIGPLFR
jgi:uncharacterized protein